MRVNEEGKDIKNRNFNSKQKQKKPQGDNEK